MASTTASGRAPALAPVLLCAALAAAAAAATSTPPHRGLTPHNLRVERLAEREAEAGGAGGDRVSSTPGGEAGSQGVEGLLPAPHPVPCCCPRLLPLLPGTKKLWVEGVWQDAGREAVEGGGGEMHTPAELPRAM